MRIDSPSAVRPAAGPRKNERSGGARSGDFRRLLDSVEADTGPASVTATSGVSTLFALQEVEDQATRDGRGAKRGDDILDRLEELRLGLLTGSVSESMLAQLRGYARAQSETEVDPRLREILDQIELRAEVELAKLAQRRPGNR